MLSSAAVTRVHSLVVEGYSQRQIAKETGVSRGTIHNIMHGKRALWGKEDPEPVLTEDWEDPERCPSCGGLVYMPCVLCSVRNAKRFGNTNVEIPEPEELRQVAAMLEALDRNSCKDSRLDRRYTIVGEIE